MFVKKKYEYEIEKKREKIERKKTDKNKKKEKDTELKKKKNLHCLGHRPLVFYIFSILTCTHSPYEKKIEENHCPMIEGSPDQPKIKGEGNSSDTSF
jgi:hypothetical protein